MKSVVKSFLNSCGVVADSAATKLLEKHFEILVINVCSLANVVLILSNEKKVTMKHLIPIRMYISKACSTSSKRQHVMSGGESMASDFYGYNHQSYSAANTDNEVLTVNFVTGVARPAISGGGKKRKHKSYFDSKDVSELIQQQNIQFATSEAHAEFLRLMDNKLSCLRKDIVVATGKTKHLVKDIMKKILSQEQYYVLH